MSEIITGRNAVIEALKGDRKIEKLLIGKGTEGSIKKIIGMALEKKIPIQYCEKAALNRLANNENHQGVLTQVSDYTYCQVEDILKRGVIRGEAPFLLLLDGVEDPHNLGAIIRSAEACGIHGVIIPKRRAVGITKTVAKASAGAVEYVPCARVTNLAQTVDQLKEAGLWIFACDMEGTAYYDMDLKGGVALIIGSEGFGVSRLLREKCDFAVSIPMAGNINSLNVSNAAAVIMCEARRQRHGK